MKIDILLVEEDFVIVNKPAGILSQKAQAQDEDLSELVNKTLKKTFLAPVHRLDRNTSGALILATNSKSAKYLSEIIKNRGLNKEYLLVCKGEVSKYGEINLSIKKNEQKNICQIHKDGQSALTQYERLDSKSKISLVKAKIVTGRPHQIRLHFSHIGHPILGDKKYAKKPWSEIFARQALHAYRLQFFHPIKKINIEATAPLPQDVLDLMARYQLNFSSHS